jgi:hypothetical protein
MQSKSETIGQDRDGYCLSDRRIANAHKPGIFQAINSGIDVIDRPQRHHPSKKGPADLAILLPYSN